MHEGRHVTRNETREGRAVAAAKAVDSDVALATDGSVAAAEKLDFFSRLVAAEMRVGWEKKCDLVVDDF